MAYKFMNTHFIDGPDDLPIRWGGLCETDGEQHRSLNLGPICIIMPETAVVPVTRALQEAGAALMFELFPPDENGDQ